MQAAGTESQGETAIPERFDPETMAGGLMEAEHRARYSWAAAAASDRDVLDAGCGLGYGLGTLAAAHPSRLVGVDVAEDAVSRARRELDGVAEVVQADVHDLPFDDGSFDVVVCFEVIEHIEGQGDAVAELKRVLRPDGMLLISSPNRDVYTPGNPHHVHEFRPEELESVLQAHFRHTRLQQQHPWLASAIAPHGVPAPDELTAIGAGRIGAALARGAETYVLAVAADSPPPELPPVAMLGDDFEVRWWEQQVAGLRRERDQVAKAERQAGTSAAQAREELGALSRRVLELEQEAARVAELRHRLDTVERELERQESGAFAEAAYMAGVIEDMKNSVSWRISAPLRALKRLSR
jgi:SAM-dependent methyltransferase